MSLTKAANAFLLLPGETEDLLAWKSKPALPDVPSVVEAYRNSSKNVVPLSTRNSSYKIEIIRLKWQKEEVGALFLLQDRDRSRSNKTRSKRIHRTQALQEMCEVFALWQSMNWLRNQLYAQQKSLQALSAESASVAEEYIRLKEHMAAGQNRLRGITKGILHTQEEERAKVSRDLHDGIGQELTALKMNLDLLANSVESGLSAEGRDRWNDARVLAEQTLQDVRELSQSLRPRMLDDLGLFPTLRWYVRNFIKRVSISVDLQLAGDEEKLGTEIQTIVFRIVQEALNNVAKHSQAKSVSVHLQCMDPEMRLQVADDGVGFDPSVHSSETGSGLAGMRDRVALYNGKLVIQSQPRKGTRLQIVIPL